MKKVLSLVLAAALAASLSACGGALVDLDTPKSEELTAQYDFYPDAMNTIRADMKITPEQADEVFIILTSCGLDGKITSISESNGAYTVYYGGSSLDVAAKGEDLKKARANAYAATEWVEFDNKYMRHDIGKAIDEA